MECLCGTLPPIHGHGPPCRSICFWVFLLLLTMTTNKVQPTGLHGVLISHQRVIDASMFAATIDPTKVDSTRAAKKSCVGLNLGASAEDTMPPAPVASRPHNGIIMLPLHSLYEHKSTIRSNQEPTQYERSVCCSHVTYTVSEDILISDMQIAP